MPKKFGWKISESLMVKAVWVIIVCPILFLIIHWAGTYKRLWYYFLETPLRKRNKAVDEQMVE